MNESTDLRNLVIGACAIVALAVVVFLVYTARHHDEVAMQAAGFAKTFIQSSPVVEKQLGEVRTVKEVEEKQRSGKLAGWYLDYDVTGRQKAGTVEILLTPNSNYGQWNVPIAELQMDHLKPVKLR